MLPADFEMWTVRTVRNYMSQDGERWATVEAWDTPDGRLYYATDEQGELIEPASERRGSAHLAALRHTR
ncbi:hypothetical protein [Nocardia terpenica]|uniref:Uncharacterized protein n=1 Tax=Nocardia terpenica TaxID=455432 RepID=A0A6G9ZDI8_9NOCA|nr:hypothetical protein [Nocardia terpenica]QIS23685.1 hypothetical protein F6W96_40835 [Nocardia terpenica]